MSEQLDYDIIIVGAGPVGSSLAYALRPLQLKVAVVEARPARIPTGSDADLRAIALSYGSQQIFSAIGLWQQLASYTLPIKSLHVSDKGRWGVSNFTAEDLQVSALGYVIPFARLLSTLQAAVNASADLLCPAKVLGIQSAADQVTVTVARADTPRKLRAKLVVAADGGYSTVRDLLHIDSEVHDHGSDAVVSSFDIRAPHHCTAYERFTKSGPLAVLPVAEQRVVMTWTVPRTQADVMLNMSSAEFSACMQDNFGHRLGRLGALAARQRFPLKVIHAKRQIADRVVLLGNAAHNLHPVAAQGFNLGLRDVATLAQLIADAVRSQRDFATSDMLQEYVDWRAHDQKRTYQLTSGLLRIFANDIPGLRVGRGVGLWALDNMPHTKRWFGRRGMGLGSKLPALARGVPL